MAAFMGLPKVSEFFDFSNNPKVRNYQLITYAKYHTSYEWLYPVWHKYRDYNRGAMLHKVELIHMANYRRIEFALLNEHILKAFYELSRGIEFLNSIKND